MCFFLQKDCIITIKKVNELNLNEKIGREQFPTQFLNIINRERIQKAGYFRFDEKDGGWYLNDRNCPKKEIHGQNRDEDEYVVYHGTECTIKANTDGFFITSNLELKCTTKMSVNDYINRDGLSAVKAV